MKNKTESLSDKRKIIENLLTLWNLSSGRSLGDLFGSAVKLKIAKDEKPGIISPYVCGDLSELEMLYTLSDEELIKLISEVLKPFKKTSEPAIIG